MYIGGLLVHASQASKSLSFFTLRDSYGATQLVASKSSAQGLLTNMSGVPLESTVLVEGKVKLRPLKDQRSVFPDYCNQYVLEITNYPLQEPTGKIEVEVEKFVLLNPAEPLPFYPADVDNLVCFISMSAHTFLKNSTLSQTN